MAQGDRDSNWPLNTYPFGRLKAAEVATMTTITIAILKTMPMAKFTCA